MIALITMYAIEEVVVDGRNKQIVANVCHIDSSKRVRVESVLKLVSCFSS